MQLEDYQARVQALEKEFKDLKNTLNIITNQLVGVEMEQKDIQAEIRFLKNLEF